MALRATGWPPGTPYRWRDGVLIAQESHHLTCNLYFCAELGFMLERAGFTGVEVRGEYNNLPATAEDSFLVYLATRDRGH